MPADSPRATADDRPPTDGGPGERPTEGASDPGSDPAGHTGGDADAGGVGGDRAPSADPDPGADDTRPSGGSWTPAGSGDSWAAVPPSGDPGPAPVLSSAAGEPGDADGDPALDLDHDPSRRTPDPASTYGPGPTGPASPYGSGPAPGDSSSTESVSGYGSADAGAVESGSTYGPGSVDPGSPYGSDPGAGAPESAPAYGPGSVGPGQPAPGDSPHPSPNGAKGGTPADLTDQFSDGGGLGMAESDAPVPDAPALDGDASTAAIPPAPALAPAHLRAPGEAGPVPGAAPIRMPRIPGFRRRGEHDSGRPRVRGLRVRQRLWTVDPWSVFKVSALFYLCLFFILMVAGTLLWNVGRSSGTIDQFESFVTRLGAYGSCVAEAEVPEGTDFENDDDCPDGQVLVDGFKLDDGTFFRAAAIGGVILVVTGSFGNVLMTVLLNLINEVSGGMRYTIIKEPTPRPPGGPAPPDGSPRARVRR